MKAISIVFREGKKLGGDDTFEVFLDGFSNERKKEVEAMSMEEQTTKLSASEFWALRCFQICMSAIANSGAMHSVKRIEESGH